MGGSWLSFAVALGLIILFYYSRKYFSSRPPSKSMIKTQTNIREAIGSKFKNLRKTEKKQTSASKLQHQGSLVLHPHSLEMAKKEFLQHAHHFKGLYEPLYLNSQGVLVKRESLIANWEKAIIATEAQLLILIWTTIIHKQYGRNFYRVYKGSKDPKADNNILAQWLNLLFKWGVKRDNGNEKPQWLLNDTVLEDGEELVKTVGH